LTLDKLTIHQPDDWHLHIRDGALMKAVLPSTINVFSRAIIMPNLDPPIRTIQEAIAYKKRILSALSKNNSFTPLMTLYLTNDISTATIEKGFKEGIFHACKLYPANATTNSSYGVTDFDAIENVYKIMESIGMPLLIHGEVTDRDVDIFDREKVFIDRHLSNLLYKHPKLKVVLEHITTEYATEFVQSSNFDLAATITPHHLHINRNAMFEGGLRSDFYCLPVAKRENNRLALRRAATSGKSCFFLGTDSAPHLRKSKKSSCGCAGIFNSTYALESYTQVFDNENSLTNLEKFASINGPEFYGLPLNKKHVTLEKKKHKIPEFISLDLEDGSQEKLVPFHAGEELSWKITKVG